MQRFRRFVTLIFTWWNGTTVGTALYTYRKGVRVGSDAQGNIYYEHRLDPSRRWVVFAREAEATEVEARWHGWLHGSRDAPPLDAAKAHRWEKPHLPNRTGTPKAYIAERPASKHLVSPSSADYVSWKPK